MKREALARSNHILCFKDELQDGKQVEIHDPKTRLVSFYYGKPRANIVRHVENWRYLIRFHDQLVPRERELDFSSVTAFTILHHLPRIYELSGFGVKMDAPRSYDYYADTYGAAAGKPRLGIAVSRYWPSRLSLSPEGCSLTHPPTHPPTDGALCARICCTGGRKRWPSASDDRCRLASDRRRSTARTCSRRHSWVSGPPR